MNKTQAGVLFIVATPIGNPGDVTLRAKEILATADAVICEELRQGSTVLKKLGIEAREIITLNEHNEATKVPDLVNRMVLQGHNLALISDAGTPVFADPGTFLINQAVQFNLRVIPIPGASSLMAALSVLDTRLDRFFFAGFLPRTPPERQRELTRLKSLRVPIILMDTPYRLSATLKDVANGFGKGQAITLAMDLTLPGEKILRGPVSSIIQSVGDKKAEFILIIHS